MNTMDIKTIVIMSVLTCMAGVLVCFGIIIYAHFRINKLEKKIEELKREMILNKLI
jgi:hypothetical protein